jgi:hypothetical protein
LYAKDNPVNVVDPCGRFSCQEAIVVTPANVLVQASATFGAAAVVEEAVLTLAPLGGSAALLITAILVAILSFIVFTDVINSSCS